MPDHRRHRNVFRGSVAAAAALFALCFASSAAAECATMIADPAAGYGGSVEGISCRYEDGAQISWTVPAGITDARFYAVGADDALAGRGGTTAARLPVTPGTTLTLEPGAGGEASVVKLGDVPLIVAGGGNRKAASYVAPGASEIEARPAGAPIQPALDGVTYVGNGLIDVSWGSFGKVPNWCVVPELKGLRARVARKKLAAANCAVGELTRRPARRPDRGRVRRQSPRAGSELPPGLAVVDLWVGARPAPAS
ncbi:MAG TPA: PASTA domain-containing protein [Solirubrobacterales bacterium]|nr:PASTA domain-containing protein [Solirubrobacterales bacterium]